MLPSGDPVSARLQGEGEPRAVADAEPGTAPTAQQRAAIADLHEPSGAPPAGGQAGERAAALPRLQLLHAACHAPALATAALMPPGSGSCSVLTHPPIFVPRACCCAGGSGPLGPNAGTPGTSILSAGYAGTTKGTVAGGRADWTRGIAVVVEAQQHGRVGASTAGGPLAPALSAACRPPTALPSMPCTSPPCETAGSGSGLGGKPLGGSRTGGGDA